MATSCDVPSSDSTVSATLSGSPPAVVTTAPNEKTSVAVPVFGLTRAARIANSCTPGACADSTVRRNVTVVSPCRASVASTVTE